MRTLEQERAANALAQVARLSSEDNEFRKKYRSYVDRLCPAIVMNGLGQALATECAAAGPEPNNPGQRAHKELLDNIQGWLCRSNDGVYPAAPDLLKAIVNNDESEYLQAQAEALAWLQWHKKFSRASFPKGDTEED